jgi:transposase-like protein
MPELLRDSDPMASEIEVPELIRAAGENAVRAYRAFLEDVRLTAGTRRVYGRHTRRFSRWAASRDLTLRSITAADCTPLTASVSLAAAEDIRSALRCVFRYFVNAGVLPTNPFSRDPRGSRGNLRRCSSRQDAGSASIRTAPPVREPVPLKTILDQLDSMIAALAAEIERVKDDIEHLCERRDELIAELAGPSVRHRAQIPSLYDVMRMSDDEAFEVFKRVRWSKTGGEPVCPRCGCIELYTCRAESLWKCKGCGYRFSVTSGTIFASLKLPFRDILSAIAIVGNGTKDRSALQLSGDLGVQYRTALALSHRIRAARNGERSERMFNAGIEMLGRNRKRSDCLNLEDAG